MSQCRQITLDISGSPIDFQGGSWKYWVIFVREDDDSNI